MRSGMGPLKYALNNSSINAAWRHVRRMVIALIGGTVVLIGVVLFFTPGPALVVIPAGLAILSIEFVWARRLLQSMKDKIKQATGRPSTPDKPEQ